MFFRSWPYDDDDDDDKFDMTFSILLSTVWCPRTQEKYGYLLAYVSGLT